MSTEAICVCDVCGIQKGVANHWYCFATAPNGFTLTTWRDDVHADNIGMHVCGQTCAVRALHLWLQTSYTQKEDVTQ
jgi:hypothetical protein